MHKVALSLVVIAASGAYVWDQARQQDAPAVDALLADEAAASAGASRTPASSDGEATSESAKSIECPPVAPETTAGAQVAIAPRPGPEVTAAGAQVAIVPRPRPEVTAAAMTTVAAQGMADGTYTGPTTDAYYGPMQIEAVVQGGQIVKLRALQYPSDRRTSLAINRQALPLLRDEVIAAQSADVDIITGATLTSEAFIRSLRGALAQAGQ